MDNQQVGYVSTQFVENASGSTSGGSLIVSATPPIGTEGTEWLSTTTNTKYTKLGETFIEL